MTNKKIASIKVIRPGSAPDIDTDIHTQGRDKLIHYVSERYGHENVANIITFGQFKTKNSFKALCTNYGIPFGIANKITALIPPPIEGKDCTFDDIFNEDSPRYEEAADFRQATEGKEWANIINTAKQLNGRIKETGVHACFAAGTLVKTDKGYTPIENIKLGDLVLTHKNTYKKVAKLILNKNNDLYSLETANSFPLEATGNHPFYTRTVIRDNTTRSLSEPKWKELSELSTENDVIGVPVNNNSKIPDLPYNLPFDNPDFWWLVGRFLGDGWCEEFESTRNRKRADGTPYQYKRTEKNTIISVGYNDKTKAELIARVNSLFDYRIRKQRTVEKIYIKESNDRPLFNYLKTFDKYALNKKVNEEVLDLPVSLLKEFLTGYLSADGSVNTKTNRVSFSTISKKLFLGMIAVVNKVYKTHCLTSYEKRDTMTIEGRTVNCHDKYMATFSPEANNKLQSFYEDGYLWVSIKKINKLNKDIKTYNLSVVDDNSYTVNNLIVHNCGVIISNRPLSDNIPTMVRQSDNTLLTQWTYPECESLGLIKMDFLGLDTLDIIENTLNNIKLSGKPVPDLHAIIHGNMDDPKTFKMLQRGDTVGIFQLGGAGVRDLLKRMKPTRFLDIAATTALYRPGPMKMNSHIQYADRKNGREKVTYISPEFENAEVLKKILGDTYGLCVPAGTPIFDSTKGIYVPIEQLQENVSTTPSINLDNNKVTNEKVIKVIHTGVKSILKLTLNDNTSISVSTTHPVLTKNGYVEAGHLKIYDLIATNKNNEDKIEWVELKEISSQESQDCYDIEVANNHNFFINNIIVHNCLYQEQCMQIAHLFAGMSSYESDQLRKAIGKKKMKLMLKLQPKFIAGVVAQGYSEEAANELWNTIEVFGRYGFNKSHSISYAINAYKTCYLKANYPVEFMSALIQQNTGDPTKLVQFLQEAISMGIKVGPVDINNSQVAVSPAQKDSKFGIVFGFAGVKQLSEGLAQAIVDERNKNGRFKSVGDFVQRLTPTGLLGASKLVNLALSGAFDEFDVTRKAVVDKASNLIDVVQKENNKPARSLFDMFGGDDNISLIDSINLKEPEYSYNEKIKNEADCIGMFLSGHPIQNLGLVAKAFNAVSIADIKAGKVTGTHNLLGTFTEIVSKTRKNGAKSVAVRIDDSTGYIDAYLPKNIVNRLEKGAEIARVKKAKAHHKEVIVGGKSKRAELIRNLYYDESIKPLAPLITNDAYALHVRVTNRNDSIRLTVLNLIQLHPTYNGSLPYRIRLDNNINRTELFNFFRAHPGTTSIQVVLDDGSTSTFKTPIKLDRNFIIGLEQIIGSKNIITKEV